jgi:hypothetical protein
MKYKETYEKKDDKEARIGRNLNVRDNEKMDEMNKKMA